MKSREARFRRYPSFRIVVVVVEIDSRAIDEFCPTELHSSSQHRAMTDVIAELPVRFRHRDGRETEGRIAIGMPVQEADQATCLAVIDGLSPAIPLHGVDTFQALRIAIQYVATEVRAFVERGGEVVELDGAPIDLPALFGRLWA
jgi:hypothetical protein